MLRYRVKILPATWEDLKKIEDYYYIKFGVESALKVSDHILDSIQKLETFLDSVSLTLDKWLNEQGNRMLICGKHIAIFNMIENIAFIYHIADTQMEYTKIF